MTFERIMHNSSQRPKDRSEKAPPSRESAAIEIPQLVRLSDLKRVKNKQPPGEQHLLLPHLPYAIVNLEGDPEVGKSFLACDLGAAATRGEAPAFGFFVAPPAAPRNVVYFSDEDSADTLLERFENQGADLDRVHCFNGAISLKEVEKYEWIIRKHKPGLLIIDPLQAMFAGINMNVANSVRIVMSPLVRLAQEHKVCILLIRHLAKSGRGRAIYRGLGSIDFAAVARSILRVGEDPHNPGTRALVHIKNSLGPHGSSVEFEIRDNRLTWLGRSELTARDLEAKPPEGRGRTALELAATFLMEQLAKGERKATDIDAAALSEGLAPRTVERARKAIGIARRRVGTEGQRGGGYWVLALPATSTASAPTSPRAATAKNTENSGRVAKKKS